MADDYIIKNLKLDQLSAQYENKTTDQVPFTLGMKGGMSLRLRSAYLQTRGDATVPDVTSGGGNSPPVASDLAASVGEDNSVNIILTATDPDLDPLTYSIVDSPSIGTITNFVAGAGTLTYTPPICTDGSDSFTFKANDGTVDSNIATVSITITPYVALSDVTPTRIACLGQNLEGNWIHYVPDVVPIDNPLEMGYRVTGSNLILEGNWINYTPDVVPIDNPLEMGYRVTGSNLILEGNWINYVPDVVPIDNPLEMGYRVTGSDLELLGNYSGSFLG